MGVTVTGAGSDDRVLLMSPYIIAGRYYNGELTAGQNGNFAFSANRLYAFPMPIFSPIVWDRIGISVVGAVAGSVRLGVYANGTGNVPSALVTDAGEVNVSTTGAKEIVISLTLPRGLSWLACISDATPTAYGASAIMHRHVGQDSLGGSTSNKTFAYAAQAYGALPSTFPAVTWENTNAPIFLRAGETVQV